MLVFPLCTVYPLDMKNNAVPDTVSALPENVRYNSLVDYLVQHDDGFHTFRYSTLGSRKIW